MGILIGGVNIKFLTASVFPVGLSGVALGATLTPRSTLTHIVNSLGTLILEGSIFKGVQKRYPFVYTLYNASKLFVYETISPF